MQNNEYPSIYFSTFYVNFDLTIDLNRCMWRWRGLCRSAKLTIDIQKDLDWEGSRGIESERRDKEIGIDYEGSNRISERKKREEISKKFQICFYFSSLRFFFLLFSLFLLLSNIMERKNFSVSRLSDNDVFRVIYFIIELKTKRHNEIFSRLIYYSVCSFENAM